MDWSNILTGILIQVPTGEYKYYHGKNISWSALPQFPACQTVDLTHYFNLSRMTPSFVFFFVKKNPNLGIAIEVGDKRKAPARRRLIRKSFEYEGAKIKLENLYFSKTLKR